MVGQSRKNTGEIDCEGTLGSVRRSAQNVKNGEIDARQILENTWMNRRKCKD